MGNGFSRERDGSTVAPPTSNSSSNHTASSSDRLRKNNERQNPDKVLVYQNPTNMTSMYKKKSARVFMEKKCWFLGRFISRTLTESSLAKLRAHVRLNKGYKTKLKLTSEGLASGTKLAGLMKTTRVPYEFTPMEDIKDIFTDQLFLNVLLCIYRLTDEQYEIVAYRFSDETEARLFQLAYYDVVGREYTSMVPGPKASKSHTMNGGKVSRSADPEVVYGGLSNNWTMREKRTDPLLVLGHNEVKANGIYRNGVIYRRPSLTELLERQAVVHKSRAAARARSASPMAFLQQSECRTFKDVAVLALLDGKGNSNFRSKPFFHRHRTYYQDGIIHSDVSCQVCLPLPSNRAFVTPTPPTFISGTGTTGSIQRHIDNLEQEVNYLRAVVTNNNNNVSRVYRTELPSDYGGISSNGNHATDDFGSDNTFSSMSTNARTNFAGQIDTSVGTVRVRVEDYRGRLSRGRSPSKISERTEPCEEEETTELASNASDVASIHLNSTNTDDSSNMYNFRQGRSKTAASLIRERNDIMTSSLRRTYNRSVSPSSRCSSVSRAGHVRSRSTESRYRNRSLHDDKGDAEVASVRSAVVSRPLLLEEAVHPSRRNRSRADYLLMYPGDRRRAQSATRYEIRRGRHW